MEKPFPAYRGDEPYIFVSYAHTDTASVYPEIARLTGQGFNIWYDEGISPGTVWRDELGRALENCSAFLLFVSQGMNASDHCMKELNFALDGDCGLLVVHLEETELSAGLRLSLSDRQAILKYELTDASYQATLDAALRSQVPATRDPVRATAPSADSRRIPRRISIAAVALIVIGMVAWLATDYSMPPPDTSDLDKVALMDRPAIAVLPFKNLSGNPDDVYFIDGLTEDLIDRLSGWRRFPVISSFSSAGYGDDSVTPRQIARELDARYLVQGSVRRVNKKIRINVALYDASSGEHIWNARYDPPFDDVLTIQDEISGAVVGQMYPQLDLFDQQRAIRRNPEDMTAWDLTQRAWWHFVRATPADNLRSQESFREASERDPANAIAAAGLALTHYQSVSSGWSSTPEDSIRQLVNDAERSVVLDNLDPMSHHALGHAYALTGNREGMIKAFSTSLELNPNSALVAICAGEGFAMAGESAAAIDSLEVALRLSPRDPGVYWVYHALALAHFAAERYDEAIKWSRDALSYNPEFAFAHRTLAASLAYDAQPDAARAALMRATELDPNNTLAGGQRALLTDPAFAERYLQGLRMAEFD